MTVAADSPPRTWRTRNLTVLSGVSLLQDAASELLYPILPIFLTSVLGAPASVVGAVEGVAEGVASLTRLTVGRLADTHRRRPLIAWGYGLAALGKLLIALATAWPVVLAGRAVDRFGKGMRGTPRDALLVEGIPPQLRGRAFGFHRTADTLGAVLGPLLGLAAYEALHHRLRLLLWVALVPAVLSVVLVGLVREAAPVRLAGGQDAAACAPLPRAYRRVVTVLAVFALVNFPDSLLLLRLHEIGFGVVTTILAYVTYNTVYAALSYPLGVLSDRLPRRFVVGGGLVAFAVCYCGLGLTDRRWLAWLLLAGYGAFTAATDGVGKAWASTLAGASRQGSAQGVFQATQGAGVLLAGLWAGLAWGHAGVLPLLLAGGIAGVLAVVLLAVPLDG